VAIGACAAAALAVAAVAAPACGRGAGGEGAGQGEATGAGSGAGAGAGAGPSPAAGGGAGAGAPSAGLGGRPGAPGPDDRGAGVRPGPPGGPEPAAAAPADDPARRARVASVRGEVRAQGAGSGGGVLAVGAVLRPGEWVGVPADAALALDFPGDARVEVDGGSLVAISPATPATVLVGRGAVRLRLPPVGGGSRSPLRAVTPDLAAVIPVSGEAFVAVTVRPPGTRAFGLAGLTELFDGTADEAGLPTTQPLAPATARRTLAGEPERGGATLQAVRASLGAELRGARPSAAEAARAVLDDARARVAAALAAVQAADTALRAAVSEPEERRREALSALVLATQRRERARAALRVAWERVLAAEAPSEPAGAGPAGPAEPAGQAEIFRLLGEDG
jgi:hypothetical protein